MDKMRDELISPVPSFPVGNQEERRAKDRSQRKLVVGGAVAGVLILALSLLAFVESAGKAAQAGRLAETERTLSTVQSERDSLASQLNETNSSLQTTKASLSTATETLGKAQDKINRLENEQLVAGGQTQNLQNEISQMQGQLSQTQAALANCRAVISYAYSC
jgi:septal ring factor EnvC (AmiA/AmiB activator)